MEKDIEIAVGVKLYIGEYAVKGANPGEIERYVTCNIEGVNIGIGNILECKYYDDITGYIYFHFKHPVPKRVLKIFFSEEEIIEELPGIVDTELREEDMTVGEYDSLFGDINYDSLM